MRGRREALTDLLEGSRELEALCAALTTSIDESQSAIAMELAEWHELMRDLERVERRAAELKEGALDLRVPTGA